MAAGCNHHVMSVEIEWVERAQASKAAARRRPAEEILS